MLACCIEGYNPRAKNKGKREVKQGGREANTRSSTVELATSSEDIASCSVMSTGCLLAGRMGLLQSTCCVCPISCPSLVKIFPFNNKISTFNSPAFLSSYLAPVGLPRHGVGCHLSVEWVRGARASLGQEGPVTESGARLKRGCDIPHQEGQGIVGPGDIQEVCRLGLE